MKTIETRIPQKCIEAFAEANNLVMEIHERRKPVGSSDRFYAHFKNAEVKDGSVLISKHGNGSSPEAAIKDYAKKIEMTTLVFNAYKPSRTEIEVPRLIQEAQQ